MAIFNSYVKLPEGIPGFFDNNSHRKNAGEQSLIT
jgi:hypothetical protein